MTIQALVAARVIGDVVDTFTPSVKMNVTYNLNKTVSNGCEFMPHIITSTPHVNISGEDLQSAYTLIMTDPDVPSPNDPFTTEYLHWMVTDIGTTNSSFGSEIVCYETPNPVIGIHRYVFLLFKQRARRSVTPPASRDNFNTRTFCHENGLGLPVAGVYFNAQRKAAARRR